MADLVSASAFLSSLLYREFVRKDVEGLERNVEALKSLVTFVAGWTVALDRVYAAGVS